jgi:hypothetical protein
MGRPPRQGRRRTRRTRTIHSVNTPGKTQKRPAERRSGHDRRRHESAPPGSWERRRSIEPRKPDVAELEITPSQWDLLHGVAFPAANGAPAEKT